MKTARLLFAFFFFTLLGTSLLTAGDLYILYDPSCMDRLEYDFQGRSGNFEYIYYQININGNEKIVLEIGNESDRPADYLPAQFVTCRNARFDRKLVGDINRKIDQVYLVRQAGRKRYFISPVSFAAYYYFDGQALTYDSPEYHFAFNLKNGVVGEDIAVDDARSDIFFEGLLMRECTGSYIFRQHAPNTATPHTDVVIVPEIGIVEERTGLNAEDAFNNVMQLRTINGKSVDDYLYELCNGKPPMQQTAAADFTVKSPEVASYDQPLPLPTEMSEPAPARIQTGYHTVTKGETLYRISRKYGVTVSELKRWNGLTTNTIYPGDQLKVSADSQLTTKGADATAAFSPAPASYEAATGRLQVDVEPAWKNSPGYHVVQRGETAAYLAMKYGYTEARFREMNNLGPQDVIKIGQTLKTSDCPPSSAVTPADRAQPDSYSITEKRIAPSTDFQVKTPSGFQDYYSRPAQTQESTYSSSFSPEAQVPSAYEAMGSRISTTSSTQAKGVSSSLSDRMIPQGYDSTTPQGYEAQTAQRRLTHLVKEGEDLYSISRMYGLTVERLRELNNLGKNEVVIPRQRIYIN